MLESHEINSPIVLGSKLNKDADGVAINESYYKQIVVNRILRYLKGTFNYGIIYKKESSADLVAYTDSDYAEDLDDRKNTSGYVFRLSSRTVSWL